MQTLTAPHLMGPSLRAQILRVPIYKPRLLIGISFAGADLSVRDPYQSGLDCGGPDRYGPRGSPTISADLSDADLTNANIAGAYKKANLTGAIVTSEQLAAAADLTGVTRPEGDLPTPLPRGGDHGQA